MLGTQCCYNVKFLFTLYNHLIIACSLGYVRFLNIFECYVYQDCIYLNKNYSENVKYYYNIK